MISLDLARALAAGGVLWEPRPGDRFAIAAEQLAGEVYWVSDMTIELQTHHDQPLLGFNGTTEWALDSVTLDQAVWLPREDQLRELLGDRFVSLGRDGSDWVVTTTGGESRDGDAETAYALALLALC
ncbi:hypothetical protein ACQP1U_02810 [Actinomycetota bacterium]